MRTVTSERSKELKFQKVNCNSGGGRYDYRKLYLRELYEGGICWGYDHRFKFFV